MKLPNEVMTRTRSALESCCLLQPGHVPSRNVRDRMSAKEAESREKRLSLQQLQGAP